MKTIFENWNKYKEDSKRFLEIEYNTALAEQLFGLQESSNQEKSAEIIDKIQKEQWEEHNPDSFYASLTCDNQEQDICHNKHPEMTTVYPVSDLSRMRLFKVDGANIGFAIKEKDGKMQEIVAVHNNEPATGGVGKLLMEKALAYGGCYLDHFDTGVLSGLYSSIGFEEYDKYNFDPQYVSAEFIEKYGEADVIFRKHNKC